jgi:hypothetical protein
MNCGFQTVSLEEFGNAKSLQFRVCWELKADANPWICPRYPYHVLGIVSMVAFESESMTTSLAPFELVDFVLI